MVNTMSNSYPIRDINETVKSELNCFTSVNIVANKLERDGSLSKMVNLFSKLMYGEICFTVKGDLKRT